MRFRVTLYTYYFTVGLLFRMSLRRLTLTRQKQNACIMIL